MPDTKSQMEAIQSMLDQGQRSVHIEKHTWLIWGISSALLILHLDFVFAEVDLEQWLHNIIETLTIIVVLFIAGFIDFKLTKKLRRQRDESISFVQLQVTKIWWFLIGLIIFINLGMNFFGGGYIFYPVLIFILGLAFYMHGLFSRPLYCWIGISLILLGAGALALQIPMVQMRWLALFVLGIGLPFISLMQDRSIFQKAKWLQKSLITGIFVLLSVIPAILAQEISTSHFSSNTPIVSLQEYISLEDKKKAELHYVRFPQDYEFKFDLVFEGGILQGERIETSIPFKLSQSIDIAFKNGLAVGYFRVGEQKSKSFLMIRSDRRDSRLGIDKDLIMLSKFSVEAKQ